MLYYKVEVRQCTFTDSFLLMPRSFDYTCFMHSIYTVQIHDDIARCCLLPLHYVI